MNRKEALIAMKEDESHGNGEIIEIADDYVLYMDYCDRIQVERKYRFAEACTRENIEPLIHIGSGAKGRGLTASYIYDVLTASFGDDFSDAVGTLAGIIIPSNEVEFYEMLEKCDIFGHSRSELKEMYDYNSNPLVGMMLWELGVAVVYEDEIARCAKVLADEIYSECQEYEIGILTTLLHEIRHLMMDTNLFLSEERFPDELRKEVNVEEFALQAYEKLGALKSFPAAT